ncbi:MAG: endolytic transglycosylase MltG [Candidatus Puniceispirillales bacterium WSBS_2018_MAG_OTU23]
MDTPPPLKARKRLFKISLAALLLAMMGVGGIYFFSILHRPAIFDDNASIIIPAGAGRVAISAGLNAAGIDHHHMVMRFEELRRGKGYRPKAGEFKLPKGTSLNLAMDIIHRGQSIQHEFTIPEGWTSKQVVDALYADDRMIGDIAPLPQEGTILPETYFYTRGARRQDMVIRLQQSQEIIFAEYWAERQQGLPLNHLNEAIVLASIVEKETGLEAERGMVASVFINRLRLGMRLQSDPTVLYGLIQSGVAVTALKRRHLDHQSPWNTYRHEGLPPTPITNPGVLSFRATLNPPSTDYLYFVADGTGGHRFAKTLAEHNANVRAWRKIRDAK